MTDTPNRNTAAPATAADKMMKVLEAEAAAGGTAAHAI